MAGGFGDGSVTAQGGAGLALGSSEPGQLEFPLQRGSTGGVPRQVDPSSTTDGALDGVPGAAAVADAAGAPVSERVSGVHPFSMWLREWGLHAEVMATFLAGAVAAFASDSRPWVALVVLFTWMLGAYHQGRALTTPLTRQLRTVGASALFPLAALAAGVGFAELSPTLVPQAFAAVGAGAITAVAIRSVRWRLQAPVRVLVVGDRAAIATATARWARTDRVHVVGGLVVEPDLAADAVPQEILGVPTVTGMDGARAMVRHLAADLVVAHPGAGVTSETFRRLNWSLEGTRCAVGVSGVLETVAPHRVMPGGLERTGIIAVRPPRPSTVVRGLKCAFDRTAGAALLLLLSPLLLAMAAAVRLDSKGPALFKQTRVGQGGVPFTVFKMRTMVQDAEAIKAGLSEVNEFDSVLFKMKRDPRVTRVGQFLRKSSLDELPQLLNVVRGEMSLVGPRPFLPEEVARMDEDTLRRHVVQPGITGLWQVSGRSDLDWEESAALDTYYADNWSLGGDLAIGLRTVKAVVAGKGAY
jgi:exopolysaccharide biosynthesis polyprenyl glycosylphosphotransferase